MRAFSLLGALFLFTECAGKLKPWKFSDKYALDVRILVTQNWLTEARKEMNDLDTIMKKQLRYYLDKDLRIYNRLDPNYELMRSSMLEAEGTLSDITLIYDKLKSDSGASLESIIPDSSVTFRKLIESHSQNILQSQKQYYDGLKKLKKGFKKDQKHLIVVKDFHINFVNTLHELKFQRQKLNPTLELINKELSSALFNSSNYAGPLNIIQFSKKIEVYNERMDEFEDFLERIDKLAYLETGGHILLIDSKRNGFKFIEKYKKGRSEYLDMLREIQDFGEAI